MDFQDTIYKLYEAMREQITDNINVVGIKFKHTNIPDFDVVIQFKRTEEQ